MIKNKIPKKIYYRVAGIIGFFGVNLIGIPTIPFIFIVIFNIAYIIVHIIKIDFINKAYKHEKKQYKNTVRKYKRIMKQESKQFIDADERCEKIAQILNEFSISKKKYKNKVIKKYEIQYQKNKQKILISSGAIICICFFNFDYVTTFAQGVKVAIESIQKTDLQSISKTEPTPEITPTQSPIPIPTVTLEPELIAPTPNIEKISTIDNYLQKGWAEFKLEYPDIHPKIRNKEFNDLYNQIFYIESGNVNEVLRSEITIWMNSCAVNTSLDNATDSKGRSAGYYSEIENEFSNEDGKRLSSSLLDEIIAGREELMDLYPNGSLAWLLANHNQTYALNYMTQTRNQKSTLYFYMKSIYYTQESLKFEMDDKIKKERIEYIQFRYKDIAECTFLDDKIRIRAYEIFIAIDETQNE